VLNGLTPFEVLQGMSFNKTTSQKQILLVKRNRIAENKKNQVLLLQLLISRRPLTFFLSPILRFPQIFKKESYKQPLFFAGRFVSFLPSGYSDGLLYNVHVGCTGPKALYFSIFHH
jgi:hypothetical protein